MKPGDTMKKTYFIFIGDEHIGTVTNLEDDMPWRKGHFNSSKTFDKYRRLFDLERQLAVKENWEHRDQLNDAIYALGLRIESGQEEKWLPCLGTNLEPGGFTLFHIRGDTVAWRPT